MGKWARKKLRDSYGGNPKQIRQVVEDRQVTLSEWIEKHGGAEAVHRFHLSAIVGAKPKRTGRITSPDNPYTGCTIEETTKGFYFVYVPPKRGERIKETRQGIRALKGGIPCRRNGRLGVAFSPTIETQNLLRSLSILWG